MVSTAAPHLQNRASISADVGVTGNNVQINGAGALETNAHICIL